MAVPTDWIEPAQQGDRGAREALAAWCLQQAFRFAYLNLDHVPNRELLAQEIAPEASLKAVTHLDQFQPGTRFSAWLQQIVRNCVRYHFRSENHTVPRSVYRRWIRDFLAAYGPELEALAAREYGPDSPAAGTAVLERVTADLKERPFPQFLSLRYEGRADLVLDSVREWLREFVGLTWVPLYEQNEEGEWVEADVPPAEAAEAAALRRLLCEEVNTCLAELPEEWREVVQWHYLERLPVHEIARRAALSPRTVYRRLESGTAALRARLRRGGDCAEIGHEV